jgi:hypothetical protein
LFHSCPAAERTLFSLKKLRQRFPCLLMRWSAITNKKEGRNFNWWLLETATLGPAAWRVAASKSSHIEPRFAKPKTVLIKLFCRQLLTQLATSRPNRLLLRPQALCTSQQEFVLTQPIE